jgi:hypothetical protein
MEITVELPDDIANHLGEASEMPRQMLEAFAAEAYRAQRLSRHQLSHLLGLDYWQVEEFLTRHAARRPFTLDDLQIDRRSLSRLCNAMLPTASIDRSGGSPLAFIISQSRLPI